MEINPKFWGSLDLPLAAGVHFPIELVNIASNKSIEYAEIYPYPFRLHWPLHGDLEHALVESEKLHTGAGRQSESPCEIECMAPG